jgi:predicted TIM-barrel fold metal-dependent hydrolase
VTDNPVQKLSEPVRFEKYIAQYPEVTFIAGHCGGPGSGRTQIIRLAQKYPNVCLDVSGDIFSFNLIPELVGSAGADRVIFGSDQPWIDPRAHLMRIFLADIKEEEKQLVLGLNALRIYEPNRLPKEKKC